MNSSASLVCRRRVFVTTTVEGFHRWPDAPEEVYYLAHVHRHLFHVRVEWEVGHEEREIEFHTALKWVRSVVQDYFLGEPVDFGARSCESIARAFYNVLEVKPARVEVSEDGECGAVVDFGALPC